MEKIQTMAALALIEILFIIIAFCIIAAVGYVAFRIIKGCLGQGCLMAFVVIVVVAVIYYLVAR